MAKTLAIGEDTVQHSLPLDTAFFFTYTYTIGVG